MKGKNKESEGLVVASDFFILFSSKKHMEKKKCTERGVVA
jgi:hypothetical protein